MEKPTKFVKDASNGKGTTDLPSLFDLHVTLIEFEYSSENRFDIPIFRGTQEIKCLKTLVATFPN